MEELSPLYGFGQWLNDLNGNECRDVSYVGFVERLSRTDASSLASAARSGFYQKCTKSALLQITDENSWAPHRVPVEYFINACQDILGDEYENLM